MISVSRPSGDKDLFAGVGYGDLLRSTDNGDSWTFISNVSKASGIKSLAGYGQYLFAGMDYGFYRSIDTGKTWTASKAGFTAGQGVLIITTLVVIHHETGSEYLFAGTNGRGVFLSSGVYFYRMQAGNFTEVKKLLLM